MWPGLVILIFLFLAFIMPNFLFCLMAFAALESYCMFVCRHRDQMLQSGQWLDDEFNFRAMVAKESRFGVYRPFLSSVCFIGIIFTAGSAMDEFGQCFWNWECWTDLDCSVNILLPALFACGFEVSHVRSISWQPVLVRP